MTSNPARQLAAEGVSLWLDGVSHRQVSSGVLDRLIREVGVTGATFSFGGLTDAVSGGRGAAYRDRLADLAAFGAGPEEAARALVADDLRAVCDALNPVWRTGRGTEGLVCAAVGQTLDPAAAVAEARWLHWIVDRPNLLVQFPADPVGLAALRRCLAEGIGAGAGPVFTDRQYREVLAAWFDGLEAALAAGRPLHGLSSAVRVPVGVVDAEVLAALPAGTRPDGVAQAVCRQAGIAVARLAFTVHEQVFDDPRWPRLARAGAVPPRLALALDGASVPASSGGLVAAGTVHVLTEDGLGRLAETALLMEGDTLSGRHLSARDDLDRIEDLGVRWPELAQNLEAEAPRRQYREWRSLVAAVGRALAGPEGG
ncbi:transaldolase family protein [Streptomyces sp. NPDC002054]|uniref:transaldolase family protein n=1 Tax=Streptomyces sp. NPDC002054 TaxID=3154663 RepID=UPI00331FA9AD